MTLLKCGILKKDTSLKKKKGINLFTKQKQSHGCRKQIYVYQGLRGEGLNWEIGIDVYTLLYVK